MGGGFSGTCLPCPGPSGLSGKPRPASQSSAPPLFSPGEPASPALVGEAVPAVEQLLCREPVVWHVGRAPANQVVGHGQCRAKPRVPEDRAAEASAVRAAPI